MQQCVLQILLSRLDGMGMETGRNGLKLVQGPNSMTTERMEGLCRLLLQSRIFFTHLEQTYVVENCQAYWRLVERIFVLGEPGLLSRLQEAALLHGADVSTGGFSKVTELAVLSQLLEKGAAESAAAPVVEHAPDSGLVQELTTSMGELKAAQRKVDESRSKVDEVQKKIKEHSQPPAVTVQTVRPVSPEVPDRLQAARQAMAEPGVEISGAVADDLELQCLEDVTASFLFSSTEIPSVVEVGSPIPILSPRSLTGRTLATLRGSFSQWEARPNQVVAGQLAVRDAA